MSTDFPKPPFDSAPQPIPGSENALRPAADHGEDSYQGHARLAGRKVLLTGGDSGIGRAVALAFAREGADLVISYLNEHADAQETRRLVVKAGRHCSLIPGSITDPDHCRFLVDQTVSVLGRIDVLVNNAAHQASFKALEDIPDAEWDLTLATNLSAMFHLCKAAVPHMGPGSCIINTSSINADKPNATLLPYAMTKGAIQNFTAGLAQMLAERGIRVNCVAPGPVWTPLIPSTLPPDAVASFGKQTPMKRPAQPRELAPAYVLLASAEASYISGATLPVTGGTPFL